MALAVRGARGARDVLVDEGAAEVVGARAEHLARALRAQLHPGDLDVVDGTGVAEPPDGVHEQRLSEGRPLARHARR